jgi:hypothetical protein
MFIGLAGLLLMVVGLLALWFPVYLDQYDQYGMQITCGRGFVSNLTQVTHAGGNGLVTRCGTALLIRRVWAIPTAVVGWLLVTVVLVIWIHNSWGADDNASRA